MEQLTRFGHAATLNTVFSKVFPMRGFLGYTFEQDLTFLENKKQFMFMLRRVAKTKRTFLVVNFSNDDLEERYLDSNFEPVGAG